MKPYIKRIEIHNYKTHKNTRVVFSPSINSIVGPNGAGKSNIVEAILFCLGERSPKNLRVSSFNEIVYNFRKDLDVSVTLTIVDSKGEEHKFKRIYSPKRGEHIYRYNGKRVSRTSYLLNLMKLGEKGLKHVYIKQGDITRWAEASPKDLRDMIHEALGLKQYNQKRREALERLQEAERKLDTVQSQYRHMQRIVYDFRDHMIDYETKELLTHIKTSIEKSILIREKAELEDKHKKIVAKLETVKGRIQKLRGRRAILQETLNNIDKKLGEANRIRASLNNEINKLNTEIIKLVNEENKLKDEIRKVKIHQLNLQINMLRDRIASERKIAGEEAKILKNITAEKKSLERTRRDLLREREKIDKKLMELKRRREELIKKEAEKIKELKTVLEQESEEVLREKFLEFRREELIEELSEIRRRINVYKKMIDNLRRRRDEINEKLKQGRDELDRIRKRVREMERRVKRMNTEIKNAYKLLNRLERILDNLRSDSQAEVRYYNDAVKVLEAAKAMKMKGVYGILSEMVKGPKRILGLLKDLDIRGWHSIIVKDQDTALKLVDIARELGKDIHVKTTEKNGVSTIPDNSVIYLLKYPKKIENIILKEFGEIQVVSTLEEALKIVESGNKAIHGDGDFLLYPGGYIRTTNIFIKLPRDVETLITIKEKFRKVIERREAQLTEAIEELSRLRHEESVAVARIMKLRLTIDYLKSNTKLISDILSRLREKEKEIQKKLEETGKERERKVSEEHTLEEEIEKIKQEITELEKTKNEIEDELMKVESKLAQINTHIEIYRETNRKRLENIRRWREEIKRLQNERPLLNMRIKEKAEEIRNITSKRKELIKQIERIQRRLEKISKIQEKLETIRTKVAEKLGTIEEKLEKAMELRNRLTTREIVLSQRINEINRRVGYEEEPPYPDIDTKEARKLLEKIEEELKELADKSQMAMKIYSEQLEPYKAYSQRRMELLKEKEDIIAFINEIDEKRREIFEEGFRKIRERFYEMFYSVFPDGKVSMELAEEGNIDSEILVYVEFKGKPRILVSTASGGERTSVILMLLLSIYSINEDTVFLFDEVDAHMDLKVVDNIAKIIKAQERYSQIILVTLPGHDSMINIADVIVMVSFTRNASRAYPIKRELLEKVAPP